MKLDIRDKAKIDAIIAKGGTRALAKAWIGDDTDEYEAFREDRTAYKLLLDATHVFDEKSVPAAKALADKLDEMGEVYATLAAAFRS